MIANVYIYFDLRNVVNKNAQFSWKYIEANITSYITNMICSDHVLRVKMIFHVFVSQAHL